MLTKPFPSNIMDFSRFHVCSIVDGAKRYESLNRQELTLNRLISQLISH